MFARLLTSLLLFAVVLRADPETIRPDAVNDVVGYTTCVVTDIDEDPDAPDSAWCNVGGANDINTEVDVEFASPTNPPTETADAQEVKVWLRKTNHTQDPSCAVDILEGNSVIFNNLINVTVTSTTGSLHSATWTFSKASWADDSGASIAVGVDCTRGGGPPGNRGVGELGAVELNLDTAAAGGNPSKRIIVIGGGE